MKISKERWQIAQAAERRYHRDPKEKALKMYEDSYRQYFEHLGMENDLKGKQIVEIGCADIPALNFCFNFNHSIIIEPMPSSILMELTEGRDIKVIPLPAEEVEFAGQLYDEVWLFNVLQHVIDPDKLIEVAKKASNTIRYFEPIDMGTNDCHPHAFKVEDFHRWFGAAVKIYDYHPAAVNFHQQKCAYGTWTNLE